MKILSIELQNINSLKSDAPIVINFESEHFKDVGLYAITGATGAGKTTILDAITIALYHSVPRFNGAKGTLLDVVSYGATEAFSRVTFENENVNYEAFWGIRLASNTGKILLNPLEEVSLKNLSTNTILSSQKRAVISEIIKVTQLDYDQFLRSVMLAQGEFASFLTAKGPEKGRLLEQITGEQIYKKIGQGILDRKFIEDNKLREIQSKINSDDVLSDEIKIQLAQKDKELDVQIIDSEKKINAIEVIVNWYLKLKELAQQNEKLAFDSNEIDSEIENHKTEFQLLALNEKAVPFKELIQNFNRNKKNSVEKSIQLATLEEDLTGLQPEIIRLNSLFVLQTTALENANKEFTAWLPQFDKITALDGQIKNQTEHKEKLKVKLVDINLQIETLQIDKNNWTNTLATTDSKIKIEEAYVTQNLFLNQVASEISNWTTNLTNLKANKETQNKEVALILQKTGEAKQDEAEFTENKKQLLLKNSEIEVKEKELNSISTDLDQNNLAALLIEKDKVTLSNTNWHQFKIYAEEIITEEKNLVLKSNEKSIFLTELETIKTQITSIKKQIEVQEIAVADAQKILDLEKSISKYEADRQNLIDGVSCGLCGSTTHPFAEKLESAGVSESTFVLEERLKQLKIYLETKSQLDKNEVRLTTSIESLIQQTISKNEVIAVVHLKAKSLGITCEITDISKIEHELNSSTEQLKSINDKLKIAQQLQIKKDELSSHIKIQKQFIEGLKNKDATFSEKLKNSKKEIETREQSVKDLSVIYIDLETDIQKKLSKFNYETPPIAQIDSFIKSIELAIDKYYKTQKNLSELDASTKVITTKLENITVQLDTNIKILVEAKEAIAKCEKELLEITNERMALLPLEISVENKRNHLQLLQNQLLEQVDLTKKELQKLLDTQRDKATLKAEYIKVQGDLSKELNSLNLELELKIIDSDFASKQDIEKALLPEEDRQKFAENKERINVKKLRLQTLKETHLKSLDALNVAKNFELSEQESQESFEKLKVEKDGLSAEKGKIFEAFRKDQEIRDRNQEVYKKINEQEAVCNVWRELFKIIGNSKDAFNVYVQRLTLKHLLDLANVHLYNLNRRYSLQMEADYKPKEELNFNLIDHYQTDQARLVDTSSGGEKFIISLALALGLSDLASKNVKIDSLFIDEGFGTLDKNTLETVISTLETLQSQGKMIGIISHVENLKERIPTQIQITKKSNGVSVVEII